MPPNICVLYLHTIQPSEGNQSLGGEKLFGQVFFASVKSWGPTYHSDEALSFVT